MPSGRKQPKPNKSLHGNIYKNHGHANTCKVVFGQPQRQRPELCQISHSAVLDPVCGEPNHLRISARNCPVAEPFDLATCSGVPWATTRPPPPPPSGPRSINQS